MSATFYKVTPQRYKLFLNKQRKKKKSFAYKENGEEIHPRHITYI